MDVTDITNRSRRQWEALARARLRKGERGTALEAEFTKEGLSPNIAKEIVEKAIQCARARAIKLMIGSASFAALGLFVTVASYTAATSSSSDGTYWIWYGPIVVGGIVSLVALCQLMSIRR